jgi:DNA-binding NtrC family response regulator
MNRALDILIIDDDVLFTASLSDFLISKGFTVRTASNGRKGLRSFESHQSSLVLLDQRLPDMGGIDVCKRVLEINPTAKIIFMTAYATVPYAVEAMQTGAFNYLSKPFELDELLMAIDFAAKSFRMEGKLRAQDYERQKQSQEQKLIGSSGVIRRVREQIKLSANSEANVLITGDTGVGKNVVARAIHDLQNKRETFLTINCSAVPENLMEAEYFGHERGVFTGADSRREGIFELADGGTLVLDEIAEIPIHLQSKLLTVLDDKRVRRIGSGRTISVDARIIATTNQNLEEAIQRGTFRRDLYYRLAVITIHIPRLREHPEDIPEIASYFVQCFCRMPVRISDDHLERMMHYPWPGNVRELRNIIERASLLLEGDVLRPADLLVQSNAHMAPVTSRQRASKAQEVVSLEEVKRSHIVSALRLFSGNKSQAARNLGISLSTLKRNLREMNIG